MTGQLYDNEYIANEAGEVELSAQDLRVVARYAAESAQEALWIFEASHPGDRRPRVAQPEPPISASDRAAGPDSALSSRPERGAQCIPRTPTGKALGVVFPELERDFIRMRTREALQVKKENGVTLGRPRSTPDDVVARVCGQPMADMLKRCGGA